LTVAIGQEKMRLHPAWKETEKSMVGVNKAILVGHLGRDPELRYTQSGQPVCNFTLATTEKWRDKSGEQQENTEWHKVVAWGKTGELCAKYLSKGRMVYVEGRIQTREWENKDGQKQRTTEINATTVQFLSGGGGNQAGGSKASGDPGDEPSGDSYPPPTPDDEIPF